MSKVDAVIFPNTEGHKLFGTLHLPAKPNRSLPAVVLLSPGVKMRVGPGRLYVPLTQLLNASGYTVLRFDFYGLGDSEGELQEATLADVYNNIEVGRYVNDTLSALNWLKDTHGFNRFMLGGLCGGAITALLVAERDRRVDSLLSIGMTVTLASNAATPAKYLTGMQLDTLRRIYFRRLLEPHSWLRLLTFRSQYSAIWRSMLRLFQGQKKQPVRPLPAPTAATIEQRGNANPLFPTAFLAFLARGGRTLMLFSEKDRLQAEYEEKFALPYGEHLRQYTPQIAHHVVANANHVLSFQEWQREMLMATEQWLKRLQAAV